MMKNEAMEKIVEGIRMEMEKNYQARLAVQAAKYAVLEEAYMNIINALHHELSGSICTIEGLILVELAEGSSLIYEQELKAEFEKVRIKRERIQESYIDTTVPLKNFILGNDYKYKELSNETNRDFNNQG